LASSSRTLRGAVSALLLAILLALAACSKDAPTAFHGVKLGMRPDDVRARYDVPGGHWKNDGGTGGAGLKLTWQRDGKGTSSAGGGDAGLDRAIFEFHNGLLVAVRATFLAPADDAWLAGGPRSETPSTVIARDAENQLRQLRWIAKDCPEHEAEVRAILAPGAH